MSCAQNVGFWFLLSIWRVLCIQVAPQSHLAQLYQLSCSVFELWALQGSLKFGPKRNNKPPAVNYQAVATKMKQGNCWPRPHLSTFTLVAAVNIFRPLAVLLEKHNVIVKQLQEVGALHIK